MSAKRKQSSASEEGRRGEKRTQIICGSKQVEPGDGLALLVKEELSLEVPENVFWELSDTHLEEGHSLDVEVGDLTEADEMDACVGEAGRDLVVGAGLVLSEPVAGDADYDEARVGVLGVQGGEGGELVLGAAVEGRYVDGEDDFAGCGGKVEICAVEGADDACEGEALREFYFEARLAAGAHGRLLGAVGGAGGGAGGCAVGRAVGEGVRSCAGEGEAGARGEGWEMHYGGSAIVRDED